MALDDHDGATSARWLRNPQPDHCELAIERLPGLVYVLEQFRLNAPEELAPLCKAQSGTIDEIKASSLFELIGEHKGLNAAVLRCPSLDARLLLIFDERVVDTVVAAVFGGELAAEVGGAALARTDRPRTGVDSALLAALARYLGQALDKGFSPAANLGLTFEGLETLVDLYALGRRDMPAVAARLTIATSAGPLVVTALLPQTLLAPIRKNLSIDPGGEIATADPRWSRQLQVGVTKARVALTAVLDEVEMTLGDVAKLAVGQVLTLRGAGMGRVRLECAGREMFWCRLAQGEDRYSLEIEEPIEPEADAVEAARLR